MPADGQPDPTVEKIRELEERLDKFRISADSGITYRGNAWQGYAVNTPTCDEIGQGGAPPPPNLGACCLPDGTCETVTQGQCILDGGTIVGTSCDPNPCPTATGACCLTACSDDCSITTESGCADLGGPYLGNGSSCDDCSSGSTTDTYKCCHCISFCPSGDCIASVCYETTPFNCICTGDVPATVTCCGEFDFGAICDPCVVSPDPDCCETVKTYGCNGTIDDCTISCCCFTGDCHAGEDCSNVGNYVPCGCFQ
jgi:hypothetical protein